MTDQNTTQKTNDITTEQQPNRYELRQQARRERLQARADKIRSTANMTYKQAKGRAEAIPFGQPILIGHHSEKRDRNYRTRTHSMFGKAFAMMEKADNLDHRAAGVGSNGISSDDPDAVKKLKVELQQLEDLQERMKQANAKIRKNDRTGLAALGFTETQIDELFKPDFCGRVGFAAYQLQNNNANIRRIRERIAELERNAQREDKIESGKGYSYHEDTAENRVMFKFDGKPDEVTRKLLKSNGFKWSPSREAWVRMLNAAGINVASWLRKQFDEKGVSLE